MKEIILTESMIGEWKAKYGKVFKTTVGGDEYVWRKLKRPEYVAIMNDENTPDGPNAIYSRQEAITKTVVLFPANITDLVDSDAGLATTIADEVLTKSGFDTSKTEEM
jgi:hypothetical protein